MCPSRPTARVAWSDKESFSLFVCAHTTWACCLTRTLHQVQREWDGAWVSGKADGAVNYRFDWCAHPTWNKPHSVLMWNRISPVRFVCWHVRLRLATVHRYLKRKTPQSAEIMCRVSRRHFVITQRARASKSPILPNCCLFGMKFRGAAKKKSLLLWRHLKGQVSALQSVTIGRVFTSVWLRNREPLLRELR